MRSGGQVPASRRAHGASGFTLIELIVAVTVMGLIVGPLTAAAEFFITHGQAATGQFADDSSVRSVISLFDTDAQSAESVTVPDPAPCGSAASALVTMTWTDDNGTIYRASWSTQTSGTTMSLVRQRCTGTSLVSTLLVADVTAAPTVSCSPNCANASTVTMTGTAANGAGFTVTSRRRPS
jgi:prepilin-type N-terminal cleavage/methylation domain-containing protein